MALTGKKRAFAAAVLAGKSNKEAAIAAGYSAATASQAGSRLVKDKDVVSYLKKRREAPKTETAETSRLSHGFDLNSVLLHKDPKDFLLAIMNDVEADHRLRVDAAKALMPFIHQKKGESGKKEDQAAAAKKVASRFASAAPPKLVVNNKP